MAEQNRTPEWKVQQDLRDQRRRSKKSRPSEKVKDFNAVPTTLCLVLADKSDLQEAYHALRRSDKLTTYFKKFRYHDARQAAVMRRRVVLEGVPFDLARKLLSELSQGGWRQGTISQQVTND